MVHTYTKYPQPLPPPAAITFEYYNQLPRVYTTYGYQRRPYFKTLSSNYLIILCLPLNNYLKDQRVYPQWTNIPRAFELYTV